MELTRYFYDAYLHKTIAWKGVPILKAFIEMEHPRDAAGRFTAGGENMHPKTGYVSKKRAELKEFLQNYIGKDIRNEKSHITAYLSNSSVNKMGSEKAIEKTKANGFSIDDHFYAARNIVSLFQKADTPLVHADKNNSPDIVSIKRFNSDLILENGKQASAYITVKEAKIGRHKIYSIEVMELKKASVTGGLSSAIGKSNEPDVLAGTPHLDQILYDTGEKSSIEKLKKSLAAFEAARNNASMEQTIRNISWKLIKWQLEKSVYQR